MVPRGNSGHLVKSITYDKSAKSCTHGCHIGSKKSRLKPNKHVTNTLIYRYFKPVSEAVVHNPSQNYLNPSCYITSGPDF